MKYLVVLLVAVSVISCKKGNGPGDGPQNPIYNQPIVFEVTGLKDTTMERTDTLDLAAFVQYISGTKEDVTLGVSNLPGTMTAGFYPPLDTPSYTSTIRLITHNTDTGAYNIKVTATSSKTTKNYNVLVRVLPNTVNPAAALTGNYLENGMCSASGSVNHTAQVSVEGPVWNRIKIQGFWAAGSANAILAYIDPPSQTLSIPSQIMNNLVVSGTGTYTSTTINIDYTVTDGASLNDNCSTVFTRQ